MPLKKFTEFLPNEKCHFCRINEVDVLYGPIYKCKQNRNTIVVHYFCLLMASKIEQNGRDNQGILGFFPRDIAKELKRGSSLACNYCGQLGATVHCVHKGCNHLFHLPCGVAKGSVHQFFDQFDSYCHSHRPKQVIAASIMNNIKESCVICSLTIDKRNRYESLWPICCKPSVLLHRKCIQIMASNAGYYFKCPLCNNTEIFKIEMQKLGIYIPEQEASWEAEPHAYQELLVRGSGCEAKECGCPRGRNYSAKNCGWQLELCKVCGGNGVHLNCSGKWDKKQSYQFNWFCEICKPVFLENKTSVTPEQTSDEDNEANSETRTDLEGMNNDSNLSSASSEKPIDISELRSLMSSNSEHSTTHLTTASVKEPTKESEDEDVIVVSENEEVSEPPPKKKSELPQEKVSELAQKKVVEPPRKLLEVEVPSQSKVVDAPSSDDDCQIVGVVAIKRKKRGLILSRKRLRTAPWAPSELIRNNSVNRPTLRSDHVYNTSRMDNDSSQLVRSNVKEPVLMNASTGSSSGIDLASYNKGSHQAPIGPRNEEHSASIPKSSEKYLDSQTSKNQSISSDSLFDQLKRSGSFSLSSKTQRDSFLKKSEGMSLPPSIGLNFSEVSINRIVSKRSVPTDKKPIEPFEIDQIIDLSIDEEQPVIESNAFQKNENSLVKEETVNEMNLNDILTERQSVANEKLDKWFDDLIDKPGPSKMLQGKPKEKDFTKILPVSVHVILSSDDEEDTVRTCAVPSSKSVPVNNSPCFKTEKSNLLPQNKIELQSNIMDSTPIKNVVMSILGKRYSKKVEGSLPTRTESTNSSISNSTEQYASGGSILQSVLSNIRKHAKSPPIKPDVLIVSDDDEDDDVKFEAVHRVKNVFTSDKKLPDNISDEPVPTKVFLSKDLCPENEEVKESPESPTDYVVDESTSQNPKSSVEKKLNTWCITKVMTLSDPICFDVIDSDSSNEANKVIASDEKCLLNKNASLSNEEQEIVGKEENVFLITAKGIDNDKESISTVKRTSSIEDFEISSQTKESRYENKLISFDSNCSLGSEQIVSSTDTTLETNDNSSHSNGTYPKLKHHHSKQSPSRTTKCEESVSSTTDNSYSVCIPID